MKIMKYFIITVDTEGDNLWAYKKGNIIKTENTKFIPRFQDLCETYSYKPVYLTNYEMLCDDEYVDYVRNKEVRDLCEVGLHLHAWNNPPFYKLNAEYEGNPYLIEYPENVMREKFDVLYKLFCEKIGHKPISHRSGRWAMDERYFKILKDYNVFIDCSVTPGIDWSNNMGETCGGSNYKNAIKGMHYMNDIFELPPTIRKSHKPITGSVKHKLKTLLCGELLELRPATCSVGQMKALIDIIEKEKDTDYLEFMLHSSELMPGCSPYFPTKESIDMEFDVMDKVFSYVKSLGYKGVTLEEYYKICSRK